MSTGPRYGVLHLFRCALLVAACLAAAQPAASAMQAAPPAPLALNDGWQLQDASKLAGAEGAAISQASYRPGGWYDATVPGTVLTSLVNDGVYPEPLYGENNRPNKIPDSLARTSYWYRKTFTTPREFAGRNIFLNFAGINYIAEVWLNGHDLGAISGAFARGRFNISPYVRAENAVAVLVQPPPHPGVPLEQTQANGTGHNGGILAEDGPTFLCTIGWDWIPGIRDRDMGLWQGVTLSASDPVTLHDPYVTSNLPLPSKAYADLTVRTTLRNETAKPQSGWLCGAIGPGEIHFIWKSVTLRPGESRDVILTGPSDNLRFNHPKLWWPNGYGLQNLYSLHLSFVSAQGEITDQTDTSFGIRKITYVYPKSGTDNLTLVVNGVPVVAKGGDWGIDEAMKRIPRARLEAEIRMHQQANYTIIRNWVGQSTGEDFYDLCDKYGILVWDEFFQPNPSDGPDPLNLPMYLANVREKILRYRSHPCIALWCGRNEGFPPPAIDGALKTMLAELDPHRLYQPSSTDGRGVHSGGPYHWRNPEAYYDVDAPFKTEIGSVSIPTLEAVHAMMPPEDWNKIEGDDWAEHDLCAGAQQGDLYPAEIAARFGKADTLAAFVREAQMADYESYRAMYEGRLCRLFAPTTGIITWMSNPAQPSTVWQLYSYDLEPNSALFAVRKACEPLHVMLNETNDHVEVINNTARSIAPGEMCMIARTYTFEGRQLYESRYPVQAAPSTATDLGLLNPPNSEVEALGGFNAVPLADNHLYFVRVMLVKLPTNSSKDLGPIISDNFYWRTTVPQGPQPPDGFPPRSRRGDSPLPPPTPAQTAAYISAAAGSDFSGLNDLPDVTLQISAVRHDVGAKCFLTVTVRNPAKTVALLTHLQLRRAKTGERILPVYYSDNYLSLVPGEAKTITVECAKSDLAGQSPALAVDGWNVTVLTASTAGQSVQVMPNDEALLPRSRALAEGQKLASR